MSINDSRYSDLAINQMKKLKGGFVDFTSTFTEAEIVLTGKEGKDDGPGAPANPNDPDGATEV